MFLPSVLHLDVLILKLSLVSSLLLQFYCPICPYFVYLMSVSNPCHLVEFYLTEPC